MAASVAIDRAGQRLVALPERALWWPARQVLFIADPHFGKAAAFRAHGLPVPSGTTAATLGRLDGLLQAHPAKQLVVLGDFLHARAARAPAVLDALRQWRARWPRLHCTLVRGNHDSHAGDPPPELDVEVTDEPWRLEPLQGWHVPPPADAVAPGHYALAGHVHPAFVLQARGHGRLRLPCFDFGPAVGVLPAFGDFTGGFVLRAEPGHQLCVVGDGQVFELPPPRWSSGYRRVPG